MSRTTTISAASLADEINLLIDAWSKRLSSYYGYAIAGRSSGVWSKKEILGYAIDFAMNNHQRVVRATGSNHLDLLAYDQDRWIKANNYNDRQWGNLVAFWRVVNLHPANAISNLAENDLMIPCTIGGGQCVSLDFILVNFIRLKLHHLTQIEERCARRTSRGQ